MNEINLNTAKVTIFNKTSRQVKIIYSYKGSARGLTMRYRLEAPLLLELLNKKQISKPEFLDIKKLVYYFLLKILKNECIAYIGHTTTGKKPYGRFSIGTSFNVSYIAISTLSKPLRISKVTSMLDCNDERHFERSLLERVEESRKISSFIKLVEKENFLIMKAVKKKYK